MERKEEVSSLMKTHYVTPYSTPDRRRYNLAPTNMTNCQWLWSIKNGVGSIKTECGFVLFGWEMGKQAATDEKSGHPVCGLCKFPRHHPRGKSLFLERGGMAGLAPFLPHIISVSGLFVAAGGASGGCRSGRIGIQAGLMIKRASTGIASAGSKNKSHANV